MHRERGDPSKLCKSEGDNTYAMCFASVERRLHAVGAEMSPIKSPPTAPDAIGLLLSTPFQKKNFYRIINPIGLLAGRIV